jgi:ubiquinone/menaquinone biosynthesis C-methylase UbiE
MKSDSTILFAEAEEAFSRQSTSYDLLEEENQILKWMRRQVRNHILSFLKPGDKILEINAGTGIDAVFFAERGYDVYVTDISRGMIEQLNGKVRRLNLSERIKVQQCSFTELNKINSGPFDYIFSNFGGLNCLANLEDVIKFLPLLLNPKGRITLVIMPEICPWEIALILRGQWKTAIRRLKKNGTSAHIEGIYFKSFYHSPDEVTKALGKGYRKLKLEGLGSFTPPPYMKNFPLKYPRIFKFLNRLDEKYSGLFPLNRWADHFILTSEYFPVKD